MITLKIQNERRLFDALNNIGSGSTRKNIMEDIASYGVSSTQQRFIDQETPEGQKWAPSQRAKDEGGQTLRAENHLFQSLTHNASADHAEWGTNIIYAAIHQYGGVIKPKTGKYLKFKSGSGFAQVKQVTIPARPFIGVNDTDKSAFMDVVNDWIQGAFQ